MQLPTSSHSEIVKAKIVASLSCSHWEADQPYLQKLKKETIDELVKFCDLYFKICCNLDDIEGSRKALKNAAKRILDLEDDNKENLLMYIEYLIRNRHLWYFLIIHYWICLQTNNLKKEFEVYYKVSHLGTVNTVYDIIPDVPKNLAKLE